MGSLSSTPANNAGRAVDSTVTCPHCGTNVVELVRHCPTCQKDLGFPNVRSAMGPGEVEALSQRFEAARGAAGRRGVQAEFDSLASEVASKSHVVMAVPALFARTFLSDPRKLYVGYEKLVGSGSRQPSSVQDDGDRRSVGGRLFGSFAEEIRYGVLSLDGTSLGNYGMVFMQLRDVAVAQRVSFLQENSYLFVEAHSILARGDLPKGYRSGWNDRGKLAAVKLEPMLAAGSSVADWACQIVCQGASRSDDKCIEAHVFGSFDANAVESVAFAKASTSRADKMDIACIRELMAKRKSPGGRT